MKPGKLNNRDLQLLEDAMWEAFLAGDAEEFNRLGEEERKYFDFWCVDEDDKGERCMEQCEYCREELKVNNNIELVSNCCSALVIMADPKGHGKCKECGENCISVETE